MDHVWTMKGPSFTNVKEERMTKERPPGPEGYHRPPHLPPLQPVINTVRNKVRDGSESTKIGYKIPQNGQKLIKFGK